MNKADIVFVIMELNSLEQKDIYFKKPSHTHLKLPTVKGLQEVPGGHMTVETDLARRSGKALEEVVVELRTKELAGLLTQSWTEQIQVRLCHREGGSHTGRQTTCPSEMWEMRMEKKSSRENIFYLKDWINVLVSVGV